MNENKLKHLEFIQNVITRMNTNSFMIKGWMAALVTALFALAAKDADLHYIFITLFPIPFLWALDAYYLSQERQFRELYDFVRIKEEDNIDFSMNTKDFKKRENSWLYTTFSKTLLLTYIPVALLVMIVISCFKSPLSCCP
jgi:hypothetical protein